MTIQQLEYVVSLDKYRHFVRAANACFVTQPTLTMQVKKLEDEIGIVIFDRQSKPLVPTKTGVQIIEQARRILADISILKAYVSDEKQKLTGTYRIGIIPTLAPYLLPLFMADFMARNPDVKLEIQEMQSEDIIHKLKQDDIDVGLLVTPLNESFIREIPLFYEPFLLYLPEKNALLKKKKIKPENLDAGNLMILSEGHCFREQTVQLCSKKNRGSTLGFSYESGSIESLKNMVKKGIGYTLIPEMAVVAGDKNRIRRFVEPEPVREVSMALSYGFTSELLAEHLRFSIVKNIPTQFETIEPKFKVAWR